MNLTVFVKGKAVGTVVGYIDPNTKLGEITGNYETIVAAFEERGATLVLKDIASFEILVLECPPPKDSSFEITAPIRLQDISM